MELKDLKERHGATYRSIYAIAARARERGLVIYGAGYWGKITMRIFRLMDVRPALFCDDDEAKQGIELEDDGIRVPVVSLQEARRRLPKAVYLPSVPSNRLVQKSVQAHRIMKQRLAEQGLLSEDHGFAPDRYLFLLKGGWEALKHPETPGEGQFRPEELRNAIVVNNMGNSGDFFVSSLIDGHPNILNIPGNVYALVRYGTRLRFLEGEELALETASQMFERFLFDVPDASGGVQMPGPLCDYFRTAEGEVDRRFFVDAAAFTRSLAGILAGKGHMSCAGLLKAIYAAYFNALGKPCKGGEKYWIYYNMHNLLFDLGEPDIEIDPKEFERLEYWFVIREPIQHFFSNFKAGAEQISMRRFSGLLLNDLGKTLEIREGTEGKTVRVIRFEDAKRHTEQTMRTVCRVLDIPFDGCMLVSTLHGEPTYFPTTAAGQKDAKEILVGTSNTVAVDRSDFSSVLSGFDIFRMNLAFQDFKRAYYETDMPDFQDFSDAFLEELMRPPFRFEPMIQKALDHYAQHISQVSHPEQARSADCHTLTADLLLSFMRGGHIRLFENILAPEL